MVDYTALAATATRLIEANGRSITVLARSQLPDDSAKPWRGPDPDNLESTARLLIGLVTGLLGVLFSVLALAAEKTPRYLGAPSVRGLGIAAVALLLSSLLAALVVVLPWRWQGSSARPDVQQEVFAGMLRRKATALYTAVVLFALGLMALGAVLVLALGWVS